MNLQLSHSQYFHIIGTDDQRGKSLEKRLWSEENRCGGYTVHIVCAHETNGLKWREFYFPSIIGGKAYVYRGAGSVEIIRCSAFVLYVIHIYRYNVSKWVFPPPSLLMSLDEWREKVSYIYGYYATTAAYFFFIGIFRAKFYSGIFVPQRRRKNIGRYIETRFCRNVRKRERERKRTSSYSFSIVGEKKNLLCILSVAKKMLIFFRETMELCDRSLSCFVKIAHVTHSAIRVFTFFTVYYSGETAARCSVGDLFIENGRSMRNSSRKRCLRMRRRSCVNAEYRRVPVSTI